MTNPFTRWLGQPTPLELAASQLIQSRIDLLEHSKHREYYTAMEEMLRLRVVRLEAETRALASQEVVE